ncbi:CHASE3 domain-containing protein [Granulicella sp. L46]|uniref:sensor histidine kinase n=1 Tax=Granulicella sp. L46 TaxID=1641865 RepID=UPI00131C31FF|nr:sensor histidine kinase [Granulicella sp. L46]
MSEIDQDSVAVSRRTLIPIVLACAILFVVGNVWVALNSVQDLELSHRWVDHTWEVIAQVERTIGAAKDAETGSRGYLLTGQKNFLQPYEKAKAELPASLNRFKQLTSDNPSQQRRADEMRLLMEHRLELSEQNHAIRDAANGRLDPIRTDEEMNAGKADMDRMRLIANQMEDEERRLLADRIRTANVAVKRVRYTLGAASILDLILILFMFRYFSRERSLRLTAEQTAHGLALSRREVERKAEEIQILNQSLELRVQQRTAELETINKELEAFSYSVSHDLRAPLRTIDGFSLALEEDYADVVGPEGKDYILRVRTGVQRMGSLIDSLLQLSRITRADVERAVVDLTALSETVASQIRDQNPDQNIEFTIEKDLTVQADAKLLRVALENLFGNAVKFSSKKPESRVDFGWDPEQLAWFVRDNGAGFDMHYKDKLFGAFNRLHGDKDFKGSGIGLATVARVVRRHHGKIWADAKEAEGATFWFTLGTTYDGPDKIDIASRR